jgi:hypothetical protein
LEETSKKKNGENKRQSNFWLIDWLISMGGGSISAFRYRHITHQFLFTVRIAIHNSPIFSRNHRNPPNQPN